MKVVLLQDVEKVGKQYETREVADGFARNFLIAKNLAKPATPEMQDWAKLQKEIQEKKAEENLAQIQKAASAIDGQEVMLEVKIGPEGQLFESITSQKIAERLKEMGFEVKKGQIDLAEPLHERGEYPVKIKFEHNLEAEIRVIISGEPEPNKEEEK